MNDSRKKTVNRQDVFAYLDELEADGAFYQARGRLIGRFGIGHGEAKQLIADWHRDRPKQDDDPLVLGDSMIEVEIDEEGDPAPVVDDDEAKDVGSISERWWAS